MGRQQHAQPVTGEPVALRADEEPERCEGNNPVHEQPITPDATEDNKRSDRCAKAQRGNDKGAHDQTSGPVGVIERLPWTHDGKSNSIGP